MKSFALLSLSLLSCSDSAYVPKPRFANSPPVRAVDDKRDTALPDRRDIAEDLYRFDGTVTRRLTRPLELPHDQRAKGVNALDEVPDSTWFTNRITARELSPDEMRNGPTKPTENPELYTPWTVLGTKRGGEAFGLIARDNRGKRFFIKFDRKGYPEVETASAVIINRLLWASGYNVATDYLARVRPQDLIVARDAVTYDDVGHAIPYRADDLKRALGNVEKEGDGRMRVLASQQVPGVALGGHAGEGRRADDPNDVIRHELRRDLRGLKPIDAWLDNNDVKESNTLDTWVTDATGRHYVMHYWLDFGKGLGGSAYFDQDTRLSHEYMYDVRQSWASLMTFGLLSEPYKDRTAPGLRGVAIFESATYEPEKWHPTTPAYLPFLLADQYDWFWGAKLLMRFSPEQLRAAVEAGELSDARATTYITKTLIERQRETAAYAFSRVAPLDNFSVAEQRAICFDDLMLHYQLSPHASNYQFQSFDRSGRTLGPRHELETRAGHSCTGPLELSNAADGYTIVEIESQRAKSVHSVFVHVARDPISHELHVIGIWRS